MLKPALKKLLHAALPRVATEIESARSRAHSHRLFRSWGCDALARALVERFGWTVQEGPFSGLTLTPRTRGEHLAPYLLGVYESELDVAWSVLLQGRYPQIVDVGAKFGYYAVGLARLFPASQVLAFDTDWWARRALRDVAAANRAVNVEVRGRCSTAWLASHLREDALIVSDCEGCEERLFATPSTGALVSAALLIEAHDHLSPGLSGRLKERFEGTHVVQVIRSAEDRRTSTKDLSFLSTEDRHAANYEIRQQQDWLVCVPRHGANAGLRPHGKMAGSEAV